MPTIRSERFSGLAILTALLVAAPSAWAQDDTDQPAEAPEQSAEAPEQPAEVPEQLITPPPPPPSDPPPAAAAPPAAAPGLTWDAHPAPQADTGVKAQTETGKKEPDKLPWHGSIFFVDQSVTTQTVGVGNEYQSRNPTYELWYSFRPRYYFYETDTDSFNVNLRFDVFHELSNSDTTTTEQEPLFGDTWINAPFEHTFYADASRGLTTKANIGPRLIWGTSKSSRGRGLIAQVGAAGGLSQQVPLAGPKEPVFSTATLKGGAAYTKHLNRCTTPCNPSFAYTRQDTEGRSLVSDQLSGASMVNHQAVASLGADFRVLAKLKLGLNYIWVMQWLYPISDQDATVTTATGPVQAQDGESAQTFRVSPWVLAALDYDLIDEVGLGIGYYNYVNQLGPDGQRRNPLWSPEARFFFTVTANLDAIYETVSGRHGSRETAGSAALAAF